MGGLVAARRRGGALSWERKLVMDSDDREVDVEG